LEKRPGIGDQKLRCLVRREVPQFERLPVDGRERAANDRAIEDDYGILGLVAIPVLHPEATAAEDAGDTCRSHLEAGLFADFARDSLRGCLTRVDRAGGETPLAVVGSTNEEHVIARIANDASDAGEEE
jgi:hypothetical protein